MVSKPFNIRLGQRVKSLRKARGLSQEALAGLVDKSVDTISNIERGIFPPRLETACEIATALETPLHDFFRFMDMPSDDEAKVKLLEEIYDLLKEQPIDILRFTLSQTRELALLKERFVNRLRK